MDREDLQAFFMEGEMGAKAWSKATAEQRAKHRASCIEAGKQRRMISFCSKQDTIKIINYMDKIKKKYGIEPKELLNFILLLPKDQPPLTEDQNHQWRELAIQQIPAAEIYQRMFGAAG